MNSITITIKEEREQEVKEIIKEIERLIYYKKSLKFDKDREEIRDIKEEIERLDNMLSNDYNDIYKQKEEKEEEKQEVEEQQNIKLSIFEYVNKGIAEWLNNNIEFVEIRKSEDPTYDPVEVTKNLLNKVNNSIDGNINTIYKQQHGRLFLYKSVGAQNIMREYRNILYGHDNYDLDMENSQPNILKQICIKKGIKCDNLIYYCENREKVLKLISKDRETAKKQILKIIFGGVTKSENKTIQKLSEELKNIRDIFSNDKRYKKIIKHIQKKNKDKEYDNINGSLLSYILNVEENNILLEIRNYLLSKKYDVNSLIFDGLLVRKNKELNDKIIKDIQKYILEKTGYNIILKIKDMKMPKINTEFNYDDIINNYKPPIICNSDKEAGDYIVKNKLNNKIIKVFYKDHYKLYVKLHDDKPIYYEDTSKEHKMCFMEIRKIISESNIYKSTKYGELSDYTNNYNCMVSISKYIMDALKYYNYDEISQKMENKYKLFFLNGYYDIQKKEFIKYTDENIKNLFTMNYINKNYKESSQEHIKYVYDEIINKILYYPKLRNEFLNYVCRSLFAVGYTDKFWYQTISARSSGKSLLSNLLSKTFNNYYSSFTGDNLSNYGTQSNEEREKALKWLCNLQQARLCIANEIKSKDPKTNKNITLNSDIIKTISSSLDPIQARILYGNITEFRIHSTFNIMSNSYMDCDKEDAKEYLIIFTFRSHFVDEITEQMKEINKKPNADRYFIRDRNLENNFNEDLQMAFINILFNYYTDKPTYKPEKIEENNIYDTIKKYFVYTNDNKNKIKKSEANKILYDYEGWNSEDSKVYICKTGITIAKINGNEYYKQLRIKTDEEREKEEKQEQKQNNNINDEEDKEEFINLEDNFINKLLNSNTNTIINNNDDNDDFNLPNL